MPWRPLVTFFTNCTLAKCGTLPQCKRVPFAVGRLSSNSNGAGGKRCGPLGERSRLQEPRIMARPPQPDAGAQRMKPSWGSPWPRLLHQARPTLGRDLPSGPILEAEPWRFVLFLSNEKKRKQLGPDDQSEEAAPGCQAGLQEFGPMGGAGAARPGRSAQAVAEGRRAGRGRPSKAGAGAGPREPGRVRTGRDAL